LRLSINQINGSVNIYRQTGGTEFKLKNSKNVKCSFPDWVNPLFVMTAVIYNDTNDVTWSGSESRNRQLTKNCPDKYRTP